MCVSGRIQTGSYTDKDGRKVYTTEVVVEDQEFAESKGAVGGADAQTGASVPQQMQSEMSDGFMDIPESMDEELPFT